MYIRAGKRILVLVVPTLQERILACFTGVSKLCMDCTRIVVGWMAELVGVAGGGVGFVAMWGRERGVIVLES